MSKSKRERKLELALEKLSAMIIFGRPKEKLLSVIKQALVSQPKSLRKTDPDKLRDTFKRFHPRA